MKRREFFEKTGCGATAILLAHLGLQADSLPQTSEEQKKKIKELLTKMGKTEEEIATMMADWEKKLPMVEEQCICKTCPSYVPDETKVGFCHSFISKSDVITEERGCKCPRCPVYKKMELKNGYYCTRMSEIEQEAAKKS